MQENKYKFYFINGTQEALNWIETYSLISMCTIVELSENPTVNVINANAKGSF